MCTYLHAYYACYSNNLTYYIPALLIKVQSLHVVVKNMLKLSYSLLLRMPDAFIIQCMYICMSVYSNVHANACTSVGW